MGKYSRRGYRALAVAAAVLGAAAAGLIGHAQAVWRQITHAKSLGDQYFSVGMALIKPPNVPSAFLFNNSGLSGETPDPAPTLTIEYPKLCRVG